jgi:tetratricopeptide (TPR) repeat protein
MKSKSPKYDSAESNQKKLNTRKRIKFIPREERAKGIEVVENKLTNRFISSSSPAALRSRLFPIQSAVGIAGILLIFASFRMPFLFFAGALLLFIRHKWRQNTDAASVQYQKAVVHFKKKQYQPCAEALRKVLQHPKAPDELRLIEASCMLELHKNNEAYEAYRIFFENADLTLYHSGEYWSPKENALVLALENDDAALALIIADSLSESDEDHPNARAWKYYYRGLSLLSKGNAKAAADDFSLAIDGKQRKSQPYIDCHYQLGFAFWKLGQISSAKKQFQFVLAHSPNYKEVTAILDAFKENSPDIGQYENYVPNIL